MRPMDGMGMAHHSINFKIFQPGPSPLVLHESHVVGADSGNQVSCVSTHGHLGVLTCFLVPSNGSGW